MKILFIQARNKQCDRFLIHPPYGLMYLASVLREQKIDVEIFDANMAPQETVADCGKAIAERVSTLKPDVIGFSGMVSGFKFIREVSRMLKSEFPTIPLAGGGLVYSAVPDLAMKHTDIDAACIGEAEEIIVEFMDRVASRKPVSTIDGVLWREGGEFRSNLGSEAHKGRRARTRKDLDWIPLPSYDLIDLPAYFPYQNFCQDLLKEYYSRTGRPLAALEKVTPYGMPLFAGRGCPFQCCFCFSTMNKKPIKHSIDYVFRHLEHLEKTYGCNHFQFMDENFNLDRKWVHAFCNRAIERGNTWLFTTGNRNRAGFFDKETLELMKAANFYDVSIGVETLDQRMLNEANRGMKLETITDTLKMINEVGIGKDHIRCLFGFPSDDHRSMYGSIRKGNALGFTTLFALVIPLPGTDLYHDCVKKGIITDELAYLEELYESDGYRNMTRYASVRAVQQMIGKANILSTIHSHVNNHRWLAAARTVVKVANGQVAKVLRALGLAKSATAA